MGVPPRNDATCEQLRKKLKYDPDTGEFILLESKSNHWRPGMKVGHVSAEGYVVIRFAGTYRKAHRLAWLYMTGEWPECEVDHIDRDRSNNKFSNLRAASTGENMQNKSIYSTNTTGHVGVNWNRAQKKWTANITKDRKRYFLGYHPSFEIAKAEYLKAKARLHTFVQADTV